MRWCSKQLSHLARATTKSFNLILPLTNKSWKCPCQRCPSIHFILCFHSFHSHDFPPRLCFDCLTYTTHCSSRDTVVNKVNWDPCPLRLPSLVGETGAEHLPKWSLCILASISSKVKPSSSTQDSSSPRLSRVSQEIHSVAQSRNLGVILHTSLYFSDQFQCRTKSCHF